MWSLKLSALKAVINMAKKVFKLFMVIYLFQGISALEAQQAFQFLQFTDNPTYQSDYNLP